MNISRISFLIFLFCFSLSSFAQREVENIKPDSINIRKGINKQFPISLLHKDVFSKDFFKSMLAINLFPINNDSILKHLDSLENDKRENALKLGKVELNNQGPYDYATGMAVWIDLKKEAQYYNPNIDGGKLWILKISSKTAVSLGFYYSIFYLPENATLHLYSLDNKVFNGPFTSLNNPKDPSISRVFGTPDIKDNTVYLEYFEKNGAPLQGKIIINTIIHGFK